MFMGKKVRHIRIRISEAQFRRLASVLIEERRNKSAIIREALNSYLVENNYRNAINDTKNNQDRKDE